LNSQKKKEENKKVVINTKPNTNHAALAKQVQRQVEKKGARGSDVQRADAATRHQGRSTCGGQTIGVKYRGFICIFFFHSGGLSVLFPSIPGVYQR